VGKRGHKPSATARTAGPVGPREPCPCGSGRRYKACHGAQRGSVPFVARTFSGFAGECDMVAMREFVPAATAPLTLVDAPDRAVLLCSLLPGALPALVREDGTIWLGLQVQHNSGDAGRDLAYAVELALAAPAGQSVGMPELPPAGKRLQELVDTSAALHVTVHKGFDFWVEGVEDQNGQIAATLEQANAAAAPTTRLGSVEAAYWTSTGTREHLRWVLPEPEDRVLDALARLHAGGGDLLGEQSRLVGSFRAHALLVPVWELPVGTGPDALEEPASRFATRLDEALAEKAPLTSEQRAARAGLATRQVTIR
jgi:Family of unknown function (DUF5926)/SEC-C motif